MSIAYLLLMPLPAAMQGRGLTGHCGSACAQSINARKANLSPVVQVLSSAL